MRQVAIDLIHKLSFIDADTFATLTFYDWLRNTLHHTIDKFLWFTIHYNCLELNQSSHYVNDGLSEIEIEMLPHLENKYQELFLQVNLYQWREKIKHVQ